MAAGEGVRLAEFGGRRAHGPQAATWVARAAYVGGFDSTSNLLAGQQLGLATVGTMAHSFIMAFDREEEAFEEYREVFPGSSTLLVDTFDSLEGVRKALSLGKPFKGIRLDSGDLSALSHAARKLLDEAGRTETLIFASGDLDENVIARLREEEAPIDAFGVGTQLATSADAPFVEGIYKLVEIEEADRVVPKFKSSPGKETYPGKKQVLRTILDGEMQGDRVAPLHEVEIFGSDQPLLQPVLRNGRILIDESLTEIREQCLRQLQQLPSPLKRLEVSKPPYPVTIDPKLESILTAEQGRVASL